MADRLVLMGVNRSKIIIQDSGVNSRAFQRVPRRAEAWRNSLLWQKRQRKLAVYTGGMQTERGIQHILDAASVLDDVMFVMAGGNRNDVDRWMIQSRRYNLKNVRFLNYLPQDQVIELQQAADIVLMTRQGGHRGSITSPLKLFEYLASGTPIVGVFNSALEGKDLTNCAVRWYDPDSPADLQIAIEEALTKYPKIDRGYGANIEYARQYTWQERQKRILNFAKCEGILLEGDVQ